MEFYNQTWFWTGLFTLLASMGGVLIKEYISNRYVLKLERIKLYETDKFKAYSQILNFVSSASSLWPPSDAETDYIMIMKHDYFENIKPNILYYPPEVRELLKKMEGQYHSITNEDCCCDKPFDKFIDEDFLDIINNLQDIVEKKADELIHDK